MKKQMFLITLIVCLIVSLSGCSKTLGKTTYTAEYDVTKITIQDKECDVKFRKTDDDKVSVEYSEIKEKYFYDIVLNNGTGYLSISRKDDRKGFSKGSFNNTAETIVYIPEGVTVEVDIDIYAGNVSFTDVSLGDVKVITTTGNLTINDVKSEGSFDLRNNSGNVEINNSSIENLKVEIQRSGNYTLLNNTIGAKCELIGYSSETSIENTSSTSMQIEITKGNVEFKGGDIESILNIIVTTGDVDVKLNGKRGDYTLRVKAGLKDAETQGLGDINVNLTTEVGDINVEYAR